MEETEAGLFFFLPEIPGRLDGELTVLEEGCRQVERGRSGLTVELAVARAEAPAPAPRPAALGPWALAGPTAANEPPDGQIALPPEIRLSRRRWAGENLLAGLLTAHLTPLPGAPVTRGRPALVLTAGWSPVPLAALLAGSGPVTVLAEEDDTAARVHQLAALNNRTAAISVETAPGLVRRNPGWKGYFGLILVHLSPYLAARRLKSLAPWLAQDGVVLAAGFAPGLQTAYLLRAAARAGLALEASNIQGDWAAVRLGPAPPEPGWPPLTGSVVPALVELPEEFEAAASPLAEETEADWDEDSLLVADEPEEDEG